MKNYIFVLCLLVISCGKSKQKVTVAARDNSGVVASKNEKSEQFSKEDNLKQLNSGILDALKTKNYQKFAEFIHPEKGVRFSMYAFVNPEKDKVFSRADFEKYISTKVKFTWGTRDGTGDPLVLSLQDYLTKWVYKRDFSSGEYLLNRFKGQGNSLNNLKEKYPGLDFTENYIAGSEKFSGMDWNSLRLVFEKSNGKYWLVAVINDEWTI